MIKNYIKYDLKEMIWFYFAVIAAICFLLYSCYNIPTYASYHDYGFTYFFSIAMFCIMIFGTRYKYKEFKKACIRCQKEYEEEKEFYSNMTFDDFVNRLYEDNEFDLDLMGCPENYNAEQSKNWLKDYIKKLINNENNIFPKEPEPEIFYETFSLKKPNKN